MDARSNALCGRNTLSVITHCWNRLRILQAGQHWSQPQLQNSAHLRHIPQRSAPRETYPAPHRRIGHRQKWTRLHTLRKIRPDKRTEHGSSQMRCTAGLPTLPQQNPIRKRQSPQSGLPMGKSRNRAKVQPHPHAHLESMLCFMPARMNRNVRTVSIANAQS